MTKNHLPDEILQVFLLEETQDETVASHLRDCAACRKKLENYQNLINQIRKITPEPFAFDVTTLVMDKIAQYETKKSKKQALAFWGFLGVLMVTILSFVIPFVPQILSVFNAIPNFTTMIGTAIMVVLFLLVDLNKQYQLKEKKIFENNLPPIL